MAIAVAVGLAIGMGLWSAVAPSLARALPEKWRVPERMAASALDRPRWETGMKLLETSDPASFADLMISWRIVHRNQTGVENCLDEARRRNKAMRCTLRIESK